VTAPTVSPEVAAVLRKAAELIEQHRCMVSPIICPFCAQNDFDKIGLAIHLSRDHCESYIAALRPASGGGA